MTKADDRQALRDTMAGPRVEWRAPSHPSEQSTVRWQGQGYLLFVWSDIEWFVEVRRVGEREVLFTARHSEYAAAKLAAEAWLADHLIPHRKDVLTLLDYAEALEARLTVHKHTDECLAYAAKTGQAHCVAECRDSREGQ